MAQNPCSDSGRIEGDVVDTTGAAIPGASVHAANRQVVRSDAAGHYVVACVPPGTITLQGDAEGFAAQSLNLQVHAGQVTRANLQLAVAAVQQDVQVGADTAGNADTDTTVLGTEQVQQLADDPDDLMRQFQALAAAAGGTGGSAMIRVDGFQNASALPPKSSIASIRVNPDLFSSEYQFPPFGGAQIEITTKPGADLFHGGIFLTDSDGSFNATDPFSTVATPAGKRRYGFDLGGPIVPKKSGFALALEKRDIDEFNVVNAITLDANGGEAPLQQTVAAPQRLWIASARGDWQAATNDVATLSFAANVNSLGNQGAGGLTLADAGYSSTVGEYDLRLTNVQTLSPTTLHESRIGYTWKRTAQTPLSTAPSVQVAGFFTGGGSTAQGLNDRERDLEIDDDLLLTRGKHEWKLGAQSLGIFVHNIDPDTFNGAYVFGGGSGPVLDANNQPTGQTETISPIEQYRRALLDLPGGTATTYQRNTGTALVPMTQWRLALYAEDSIKLTPRWTASAGLRYALQTNPGSYRNFGPRLSLAWSLNKKQTWILHLRGGLFEFPTEVGDVADVSRLNGVRQKETTIYSPAYSSDASQPPASGANALQVSTVKQFAPAFAQNLVYNTILSLEHQFSHHWLVHPGLYWGEDWDTLWVRNINAPMVASNVGVPADPSAALLAPRPIAPDENILEYQNAGHLMGNLVSVGVEQHGSKWLDFWLWYGHFHFKSSNGEAGMASPQSSYSDHGESARVDWLTAHRVALFGEVKLPYKLAVSTNLEAKTGLPYNVTTGTDNNGDGIFNDRPAYASALDTDAIKTKFGWLTTNTVNGTVPRNLGTMPGTIHLDMNMSRTFTLNPKDKDHPLSLTLNARSANLLNRTNVTAVGTVVSSSNFSQPVAAETARRVELGARFTF